MFILPERRLTPPDRLAPSAPSIPRPRHTLSFRLRESLAKTFGIPRPADSASENKPQTAAESRVNGAGVPEPLSASPQILTDSRTPRAEAIRHRVYHVTKEHRVTNNDKDFERNIVQTVLMFHVKDLELSKNSNIELRSAIIEFMNSVNILECHKKAEKILNTLLNSEISNANRSLVKECIRVIKRKFQNAAKKRLRRKKI